MWWRSGEMSTLNPIEICPACQGSGRQFRQVDESHRQERICPDCDGTGSIVDALAGKLSGEAEDRMVKQQKSESEALLKRFQSDLWYS